MLYLFDEYKAAYPDNEISTLIKFENYPKNLHELTLDEFNGIIKDWTPAVSGTVHNWKSQINNYLMFLKKNNCKVNTDVIRHAAYPIKRDEFLIFSTDDIRHYYNVLFEILENHNAKYDTRYYKQTYYVCYAAGILAFCGLSLEQIVELNLSDVQPDGVIGYNLPLTKEDIDVLLAYKSQKITTNNMPLIGTKYIRTTKNKEKAEVLYLSRTLSKTKIEEQYKYITEMLNVNKLYNLGKFNRVYQAELESKQIITKGITPPDYFFTIMGLDTSDNISNCKNKYIKYREQRNERYRQIQAEKDMVQAEPIITTEATEQDNLDVLTKKLDAVLQQAKELTNSIEAIKNSIELVKNKK